MLKLGLSGIRPLKFSILSLIIAMPFVLASCNSNSKNGSGTSDHVSKVAQVDANNPNNDPSSCLSTKILSEVKGMVCSTQGSYTYVDFDGSDLKQLDQLKFKTYDSDGKVVMTGSHPSISHGDNQATKLVFGDEDHMSLEGVDLKDSSLDFGYVIIGGNSGGCQAVKSGTPISCFKAFQDHHDRVSVSLPEYIAPKNTATFLFDKVKLHKAYDDVLEENETVPDGFTYEGAVEYCRQLGARLPTNRELAIEMETLAGEQTLKETAYPNVAFQFQPSHENEIRDEGLRAEFHDMYQKGFEPSYKVTPHGWAVDFYFKTSNKGRGLAGAVNDALGKDLDSFGDAFSSTPGCEGEPSHIELGTFINCEEDVSDNAPVVCVKDN